MYTGPLPCMACGKDMPVTNKTSYHPECFPKPTSPESVEANSSSDPITAANDRGFYNSSDDHTFAINEEDAFVAGSAWAKADGEREIEEAVSVIKSSYNARVALHKELSAANEKIEAKKKDFRELDIMWSNRYAADIKRLEEKLKVAKRVAEEAVKLCEIGCVEGEMREDSLGDLARDFLSTLQTFPAEKGEL